MSGEMMAGWFILCCAAAGIAFHIAWRIGYVRAKTAAEAERERLARMRRCAECARFGRCPREDWWSNTPCPHHLKIEVRKRHGNGNNNNHNNRRTK